MSSKKQFTLEELAEHNTKKSLYVSIKGKVYDVTKFIEEAGEEVLLDEAGRDATEAFEDVGHSDEAIEILKGLEIGELKDGIPPPVQKPIPKPVQRPKEESSLFSYLLPVAVIVAYIAYKYVTAE
ncbi:2254_t:CDS:2 [Gigaspora rosea]|nr:2254_t:CDS:2 [Gigaspora rosea]